MRIVPSLIALAGLAVGTPVARAEVSGLEPKVWLGIGFEDHGGMAQVTEVHPGTGAESAGLLADDQIVAIDGIPLSMAVGLPELVSMRTIGQRISIDLLRGGRHVRVTPRLTVKPTIDEIVYQRLIDRALPVLTLHDRHRAVVPSSEWARRPQVWMVFDAKCDRCAVAAADLRARLVESGGGAPTAPLRAVVLGHAEELDAYLARVPLLGTVWRVDRGEEPRFAMLRRFLSGVDIQNDGVLLVIDQRGVVRFATAVSAGEPAHEGACAAAARATRAWRP